MYSLQKEKYDKDLNFIVEPDEEEEEEEESENIFPGAVASTSLTIRPHTSQTNGTSTLRTAITKTTTEQHGFIFFKKKEQSLPQKTEDRVPFMAVYQVTSHLLCKTCCYS